LKSFYKLAVVRVEPISDPSWIYLVSGNSFLESAGMYLSIRSKVSSTNSVFEANVTTMTSYSCFLFLSSSLIVSIARAR
jgi:hypothetical protein